MRCDHFFRFRWAALLCALAAAGTHGATADDLRFLQPLESVSSGMVSETSTGTDAVRTAAITEIPTEHPLRPAILLARKSLEALQSVADYEATYHKEERLNGTVHRQTMQIRLRESPFSVYLLYDGESSGREVLYVQGKHGNQLLTREGSGLKSLVGTVSLTTDGVEAMQENRYPITSIGMRRMLETVLAQWQEESQYGETQVEFYPDARLGGRPCQVIESSHPQPRRQFTFHKTRLFIDAETRLPIRVEQYGFPRMPGGKPPLEELYSYSDIRTNVGLNDADFSRDNPSYGF